MTRPHSLSTRALAALAVSLVLLTGCTADPKPSPSPTPTPLFASKKDAFAAAEAAYREFVDRVNEVDTADPHTFEPLFERSSGDFEASDRKTYSTMHAEGIAVAGDAKIVSFAGLSSNPPYATVEARACLDVSEVTATDPNGNSVVDPARPDVYALRLTFVAEGTRYTINEAHQDAETAC